ncbi:YecA family protein, partial [Gemmatimonas sp.]|uniref:YecA family protein n=2 Tax=Gemmatimonas sp. TaxID=1962908 RepID=UPI00391B9F74
PMRNDPCPCGSGKKFKKCHGAAVPPEVAALPTASRAEWQRAEVLLQRQKRIGQEVLDWATKKLGVEWTDGALDAWGLSRDEDISDLEADLYTGWVLFAYTPATLGVTLAAGWLNDAGKRAGADDQAFVRAGLGARLGIWEAETVEEGVGATLTDRLTGRTLFVHEPDLTHTISPSEFVCAYVLEAEGVHIFAGLHEDTLLHHDGQQFVAELVAEWSLTLPVPDAQLSDAAFQAKLARRWHTVADTLYADEAEGGDDEPDQEPS